MRIRIKQSRPQNLNDAIRLAVELETFNRAERRVTEGRSYLRTTAGKESEKANDQSDVNYWSNLLPSDDIDYYVLLSGVKNGFSIVDHMPEFNSPVLCNNYRSAISN
jgi:hypothetical protein